MELPSARELLPDLGRLIADVRDSGGLVVYTRQANAADGSDLGVLGDVYPHLVGEGGRLIGLVSGTPGIEVHEALAPVEGDIVVDKKRFSAFAGTGLEEILREHNIDTVIVTGCVTNGCCESTARDAVCRDFRVVFAEGGTATRDLPDMGWGAVSEADVHRVMQTTLAFSYGEVATPEDIVARLKAHVAAPSVNGR